MVVLPGVPVLGAPINRAPDEARVLEGLHQSDVVFGEDALDARREPVWKSKFYGVFVLNRRVVLHAIDATTAASSPRNDLVKNYQVHPTQWLISTQPRTPRRCPRRRDS